MKKILSYNIVSSGFLGSQITIQVLYDEAPDSVKISVYDSSDTEKIDDASMTVNDNSTKSFSYYYVSDITDLEGEYKAVIEATFGDNTVLDILTFSLEDSNTE